MYSHKIKRKGFTLLLSVIVVSIVLAIGISILNITLKEFQLSNLARESERALYAADAGLECAFYYDFSTSGDGDSFDIGSAARDIKCMGEIERTADNPGNEEWQQMSFDWVAENGDKLCSIVRVRKVSGASIGEGSNQYFCPAGVECTDVVSLGYNKSCANLPTKNTVERRLRALY